MTSSQRVPLTYSVDPAFQSSEPWSRFHAALLNQFPLRNLHWKSALRPSLRTIQELHVNLIPLENVQGEQTSQVPSTLLERPLLNLYIVNCENIDVEKYRTVIKKQIKDWHNTVVSRKNQEWLIVHVVTPDVKATGGNFFQLKGSVLDKIKADFNVDKRDRCIQIVWSKANDSPAAWAELISKLKDSILLALDTAVTQKEEEVKRSESQRQMPGWNFCKHFILKESLAASFEGVNLIDDAILQFDELELSFSQVLKEKSLSWFGTLVTPTTKDDSAPLLSVTKKPYRDLIIANTISIFDFRIYLLARQCTLLGKNGRMPDVAKKVTSFLGAFGRRLRDIEGTLPRFFIESWTYSSALSVVDQCDQWILDRPTESVNMKTHYAANGELVELARYQLDILGIKAGHLPPRPTIQASPEAEPISDLKISQQDIVSALQDKSKFYDLYMAVTNRAIDLYVKAGRKKFALKLHASLAALDVYRGRLDAGLATYRSLPAHYAPHMWHSLEGYMLSQALDVHAQSEQPQDREWIHVLLAYLKAFVENKGNFLLAHEEDKAEYITSLVSSMESAAAKLDSEIRHTDHPAFSLLPTHETRFAEGQDGHYLDVVIQNHLPCLAPVEKITVLYTGRDSDKLEFSASTEPLRPGSNTLSLFCPVSCPGTYLLDSSTLQIGKLYLEWNHKLSSTSARLHRSTASRHTILRVPTDPLAFDIRLQEPRSVELGKPTSLALEIYTGRNEIRTAKIALDCGSASCQISLASLAGDSGSLEASEDSIVVSDLPVGSSSIVSIPISNAGAQNSIKVDLSIEYTTASEPELSRHVHVTRSVVTALPVSVNVEDFFQGQRLVSKFSVTSTSAQHVRVSEARLECSDEDEDDVKIVSCRSKKAGIMTITSTQPASYMFTIESSNGPVRQPLTLMIRYRMLREEVESVARDAVASVITSPHAREAALQSIIAALRTESTWVEKYITTGELHVPTDNENGEDLQPVILILRKGYSIPVGDQHWREIRIPVDVPRMDVVAAARISLPTSNGRELYAGQPVSATLSIDTSFHWGNPQSKDGNYKMQYDIEELVHDWLVCGHKRGWFEATHGGTFSLTVTLIALHHGKLPLPKVSIKAIPVAANLALAMGSMGMLSIEARQLHGAETVLILPRTGRTTYVVATE